MDSAESNTDFTLLDLMTTDIRSELPPEALASILSQPPFVVVPSVANVRDLGSALVRSGFAYRSAALTGISEEGQAALRKLGVGVIFDLRNPVEREKAPSPAIDGIDTIWEPYTRDPLPPNPADFADEDGVDGFVAMYKHILEISVPIFRKVFEHIRDQPQKPFLFHCNAGKDRTGVLAALILLLVETPSEAIVHDYALSRIGGEPARGVLLGPLLKATGPMSLENPGLRNICSVPPGAMVAFIKTVDEGFGGAVGYLTKELGFSAEDVATITAHLKATPEAGQ